MREKAGEEGRGPLLCRPRLGRNVGVGVRRYFMGKTVTFRDIFA